MRILLIAGSLPPFKCGIGDYSYHLAQALSGIEGVRVAVLTDGGAAVRPSDARFEFLPAAERWGPGEASRILAAGRRWRPDLIHLQFPSKGYGRQPLPWFLPLMWRSLRYPVVQTWHEYCPMGRWRSLPTSLAGGGLVAVRPGYLERMSAGYRWLNRRKNFRFIPNACTIPPTTLTEAARGETRSRFISDGRKLLVYFGFAYPAKGVETVFEVADPQRHHLVLVCDLQDADPYHRSILDRVQSAPWKGHVTVTGFQSAAEVGRLLCAADAVVLPFREGGGLWNSSLHGAVAQGTFVLTTSRERQGYDTDENVYYALPTDLPGLRKALDEHVGRRNLRIPLDKMVTWDQIAKEHVKLYSELIDLGL